MQTTDSRVVPDIRFHLPDIRLARYPVKLLKKWCELRKSNLFFRTFWPFQQSDLQTDQKVHSQSDWQTFYILTTDLMTYSIHICKSNCRVTENTDICQAYIQTKHVRINICLCKKIFCWNKDIQIADKKKKKYTTHNQTNGQTDIIMQIFLKTFTDLSAHFSEE